MDGACADAHARFVAIVDGPFGEQAAEMTHAELAERRHTERVGVLRRLAAVEATHGSVDSAATAIGRRWYGSANAGCRSWRAGPRPTWQALAAETEHAAPYDRLCALKPGCGMHG